VVFVRNVSQQVTNYRKVLCVEPRAAVVSRPPASRHFPHPMEQKNACCLLS